MSAKTRTPKETVKIRRLPAERLDAGTKGTGGQSAKFKVGDEITLKATVTRTGRNTYGTADVVTVRIPGAPAPLTLPAEYLEGED
jgi:hypothetical protein